MLHLLRTATCGVALITIAASATAQERPPFSEFLLPAGLRAIYAGDAGFIGRAQGFDRGVRIAYVFQFAMHLHWQCRSFGEATGAHMDEANQALRTFIREGRPHLIRTGLISGAKFAKADFRDWATLYPTCGSEAHRTVEASLRRMLPLDATP